MSQFIPIEEMSLDGYQIVNAGLFHHPARKRHARYGLPESLLTSWLWKNCITVITSKFR